MVWKIGVRDQGRRLPSGHRILEHAFGCADVRDRVRSRVSDEAIVLDQAVVRAAGEGEDRELEGVEGRQAEERGVGGALGDGGAVEAVEIVAGEDVVGVEPGDELAMGKFDRRALLALPEAFFASAAGGQRVEGAVVAELDIDEKKGQNGPRVMTTTGSGEDSNC